MTNVQRLVLLAGVSMGLASAQDGGVYGRIISPTGEGVAAAISVTNARGVVIADVKSAADGTFDLGPMAPETVRFVVRNPGFREERRSVTVTKKEKLYLVVALTVGKQAEVPQWSVGGTVRDDKGAPVKDAIVTLRSMYRPGVLFQTKTDKLGQYKAFFDDVGQLEVSAENGASMGLAYVVFGSEPDRPVDVVIDMAKPQPPVLKKK